MNARLPIEFLRDDPLRVGSPYTLPNEPDEDAPAVTRQQAVAAVRACLSNETAGAFGQSARIWGESLLNELAENQAGAALVILAAASYPRIHEFLQDKLEAHIEKTANNLLAEMDSDELEAYL